MLGDCWYCWFVVLMSRRSARGRLAEVLALVLKATANSQDTLVLAALEAQLPKFCPDVSPASVRSVVPAVLGDARAASVTPQRACALR